MLHRHGGDIYPYREIRDFSANINYRGMPRAVAAAARRAVADSVHYPDPQYRALRRAVGLREGVGEDMVICGNGAAELLFALASAFRPRRALVAVPSFFEYEQALFCAGCGIDRYPLRREDDFRLDKGFLDAVRRGADLVILGNPNNPTGQLLETAVLRPLLELCRKEGILLVLDESFYDFLCAGDRERTFSGVSELGRGPGLFVLKSFTKMYAMPGLRFGYGLCGDPQLLGRMREMLQPWNVSLPAERAARAAAAETEFALESARQTALLRGRLKEELERAGYPVFDSCANFLLFLGAPGLGTFCRERGFLLRECGNFPGLEPVREADGEVLLEFYRVCVRGEEENRALLSVLRAFAREQRGKEGRSDGESDHGSGDDVQCG